MLEHTTIEDLSTLKMIDIRGNKSTIQSLPFYKLIPMRVRLVVSDKLVGSSQ